MLIVAHRRLAQTLFFTVAFALTISTIAAGDWPTFRGPDRTGVSKESGLLRKWPSGGPPLVWKMRGAGRGYADLTVVGERIYTLGDGPSTADDKNEYLVCFERATGKPLWKTKTGDPWTSGQPNWRSSRSTPTVDGALVAVLTPHGELVCCDSASGKELWRKSLPDEFGGKKADNWGYSESPLIDGDHLVCTPGGDKATMVALNKQTGELAWKAVRPGDRGAGHSSIVVSEIVGTKVYVQMTGGGALGVRASDGKLLWSYPIGATTAVIPTPIVRGDLVFFSAGYKRGGALLKQVPGEKGEVSIKEIYAPKTSLANKHGGVVLVGDYVYGDTENQGVPFCAELMTGKLKWKKRGSGRGSASFAAADHHLYIHFEDGTMVLAAASPKSYTEAGSFKVPGSGERPSWSHPVILDGKLYLREQDTILCYDIHAHDAHTPVTGG
jgi:outer membrane protein assembly factor BamB